MAARAKSLQNITTGIFNPGACEVNAATLNPRSATPDLAIP